jgi:hypothetical protein
LSLLKTLFVITISTARLVFPSVSTVPEGVEAPKPPVARMINVELASQETAVSGSKASVTIPESLKLGSGLDLSIDFSTRAAKPEPVKFELREYWGSGQTAPASQPKITTSQEVRETDDRHVPEKSFAFWPGIGTKPFDADMDFSGTYTLNTNYCGSTSVTLTKDQRFLDPVDVTVSPAKPDLDKPIVIRWKPVQGAVGYLLRAYGGGQNRSITWTSSAKSDISRNLEFSPVSPSDLEDYIKHGVLAPSYVVSSTIPAGIFKGSSSVMLIVTAIGKDITQTKDDITSWVLVRSTASVPLYSTSRESEKEK